SVLRLGDARALESFFEMGVDLLVAIGRVAAAAGFNEDRLKSGSRMRAEIFFVQHLAGLLEALVGPEEQALTVVALAAAGGLRLLGHEAGHAELHRELNLLLAVQRHNFLVQGVLDFLRLLASQVRWLHIDLELESRPIADGADAPIRLKEIAAAVQVHI